jgi:hypothetical protein
MASANVTNIHNLQLLSRLYLPLHGHRVHHHDPAQLALVQHLNRIPRQYPMSDNSDNFMRAVQLDCLSGFHERAARVSHVVGKDGSAHSDVVNGDHVGDFIRAGALFVDKGEAKVKAVGDRGCSLRTPRVRTNNMLSDEVIPT